MKRAWAYALVLAACAWAGQDNLATVEGRVTNSITGEPLPRVRLTLFATSEKGTTASAKSDPEGRFRVDSLDPGTYTIGAEKAGFLSPWAARRGANKTRGPQIISLTAGQQLKDVEIKLVPQGVITGKVVDEDGDPFTSGSIAVYQAGSGRTKMIMPAGAQINDMGEFRVASLTPGRYYVTVMTHPQMMMGGRSRAPKDAESYVQTFYPGVTDVNSATAIDVKAGQEIGGVLISMRKARSYSVSGHIAGGAAGQNLQVMLMSRDAGNMMMRFGGSAQMKPDGSFEFERIAPGAYTLSVMGNSESGMQEMGHVPVDVSDGPLKGITVTLSEPLVVTGTVRIDSEAARVPAGISLALESSEGQSMFGGRPIMVKPDGTFRADGVVRQKVFPALMSSGAMYLKSVRFGPQEVLDTGLDLTDAEGTVKLEVVIGTRTGTIEGTVQQDGKPQSGVTVLAMRQPQRASFGRVQMGTVDQNGRYTIRNVPPGDYMVYGLPGGVSNEVHTDPDYLKSYEGKAVKIRVEEGATARADLAPIAIEAGDDQ